MSDELLFNEVPMGLKKRTIPTHFVEYYDFERFVYQTYGTRIDFPVMQESSNDTSHTFNVDGAMDDYAEEKFAEFLAAPHLAHYTAQVILDKLCADKHIEPGCYVIEVSW